MADRHLFGTVNATWALEVASEAYQIPSLFREGVNWRRWYRELMLIMTVDPIVSCRSDGGSLISDIGITVALHSRASFE